MECKHDRRKTLHSFTVSASVTESVGQLHTGLVKMMNRFLLCQFTEPSFSLYHKHVCISGFSAVSESASLPLGSLVGNGRGTVMRVVFPRLRPLRSRDSAYAPSCERHVSGDLRHNIRIIMDAFDPASDLLVGVDLFGGSRLLPNRIPTDKCAACNATQLNELGQRAMCSLVRQGEYVMSEVVTATATVLFGRSTDVYVLSSQVFQNLSKLQSGCGLGDMTTKQSAMGASKEYDSICTHIDHMITNQCGDTEPCKTLFDFKHVFLPVCIYDAHWLLVSVSFSERSVTVYDSLPDMSYAAALGMVGESCTGKTVYGRILSCVADTLGYLCARMYKRLKTADIADFKQRVEGRGDVPPPRVKVHQEGLIDWFTGTGFFCSRGHCPRQAGVSCGANVAFAMYVLSRGDSLAKYETLLGDSMRVRAEILRIVCIGPMAVGERCYPDIERQDEDDKLVDMLGCGPVPDAHAARVHAAAGSGTIMVGCDNVKKLAGPVLVDNARVLPETVCLLGCGDVVVRRDPVIQGRRDAFDIIYPARPGPLPFLPVDFDYYNDSRTRVRDLRHSVGNFPRHLQLARLAECGRSDRARDRYLSDTSIIWGYHCVWKRAMSYWERSGNVTLVDPLKCGDILKYGLARMCGAQK